MIAATTIPSTSIRPPRPPPRPGGGRVSATIFMFAMGENLGSEPGPRRAQLALARPSPWTSVAVSDLGSVRSTGRSGRAEASTWRPSGS